MGDISFTSPYAPFIDQYSPSMGPYEDLYKHLHQNPELSTQEKQTAATIESRLRKLSSDLEVKTSIGGYGIIAVLSNGPGTTILLRADFDALPVLEKTGLPYASKATQVDERDGRTKPVMHACGHDFHVTALLACCETLLASRDHWSGTVIFLFQPAEERGLGAQAMISDGLYDPKRHNCPVPDVVLGQHVFPIRQATLCTKTGTAMSAADSLKITIHGRGGHGSMPHRTIDPVVIASSIVLRLQTIVSREVPPAEMAVLTVGSIQAGDAENVIPFEAVIKCNTRTVTNRTREKVRKAIERIVKAECVAGGCEREPEFEEISSFPLTVNDADIVEKLSTGMEAHFGERYSKEMQFALGSEDFSLLASSVDRPYCFWFFGGIEGKEWDELAEKDRLDLVPTNHSPFFAPVLQPTLKTGMEALVVASLTYLGKEDSNVLKGKL
jgi:amidohydrolase